MKKGLLGSTALIGATVLMAGAANVASAAEAPEWKLSGNMNFQAYFTDQDTPTFVTATSTFTTPFGATSTTNDTRDLGGLYFGVDEAELQLNVSGSTDNGLDYGFKIEIQTNTDDGTVADEARIQLGGSWGTLQLGDEDGAEDSMNYGGESLMGATGGFDGDQGDWYLNVAATSTGPNLAADSSDATKITYYSPRTSGFQVGASFTPEVSNGDTDGSAGLFNNHIGIGANYDGEMGGMRIRASAVYGSASFAGNNSNADDVTSFQVGGVVNFGQLAVGANYGDNGDLDNSFFDVAASYSQGPIGLAAGYFKSTTDFGAAGEETYEHIALTADYSMAPGLGVYAELGLISSETTGGFSNDGTGIILGTNVSF